MTDNNEIPNPDKLDIQPNFKMWLKAFFHGHTHVTYAGLIAVIAGLMLQFTVVFHQILGLLLIIIGVAIVVDESAHMFSN